MDQADLEALRAALSLRRMAPFETACNGDRVAANRLYAWDIQVAGAFYGLLSCLETGLRNAMQEQLAARFGQVDWWVRAENILHWGDMKKLAQSENELLVLGRAATPEAILDNLPLGFWVSLLGSGNQHQYENRLWRPILHRSFPGYRGPRKPLHRDFDHVRTFRNRIAHHKPIFARHLEADHTTIYRLTGYISSALVPWMADNDRVPEVLANRADICCGLLPTSF